MITCFSGLGNCAVPFTKIGNVRGRDDLGRWHGKKMNFGHTEFKVFAAHPGKDV